MRANRKRFAFFAAMVFAVVAAIGAVATAKQRDENADNSHTIKKLIDPHKPKNVIVLIGDGMGDSEITLARYYGKGAAGTLNMETLPFSGELITYGLSAGPGPEYPPNYVPDSAPTATCHRRDGSGSRPRTIWLRRSSTSAATRSAKCVRRFP